MKKLTINKTLWSNLIIDLKGRGEGVRESGAFLLGKPNSYSIIDYIPYDELDKNALETGMIVFSSAGFVELTKYCQLKGLVVYADVHTHPKSNTLQSLYDRTNPMVAIREHVGIILPNFANTNSNDLKGVGIYEYECEFSWKTYKWNEGKIVLT